MNLRSLAQRDQFELAAKDFLARLFTNLNDLYTIDLDSFELDHICWRSENYSDYNFIESILLHHGRMFHKNIHNGRPISLITLDEPIKYSSREIYLIELPAPRAGKPYQNGFEHAEFVINSEINEFVLKHPILPFNTENIGKRINPDVKLTVGAFTVKFHPYSLAHVVKNLE